MSASTLPSSAKYPLDKCGSIFGVNSRAVWVVTFQTTKHFAHHIQLRAAKSCLADSRKPPVLLFSKHGKPFFERRWGNTRRTGLFSDRFRHGLRWRILPGQSSQRGGFVLELLRRKHFRYHLSPNVVRSWHFILERSKQCRVVSDGRRRTLYFGGRDCEHAHLFSADQSF
jgi:hypothetical protein